MTKQAEEHGAIIRNFAPVEQLGVNDDGLFVLDQRGRGVHGSLRDPGDRRGAAQARRARRGRVHRPRRLVVRHLRRRALQRQGGRGRRRRGRGGGGGDVPHEVRDPGPPDPSPRRAAGDQVHPGALLRQRQDRDALEPRAGRDRRGGRQGHRRCDSSRPTARRRSCSRSTASSSSSACIPTSELAAGLCELDESGYIRIDHDGRTSVPGLVRCRRRDRLRAQAGDHCRCEGRIGGVRGTALSSTAAMVCTL